MIFIVLLVEQRLKITAFRFENWAFSGDMEDNKYFFDHILNLEKLDDLLNSELLAADGT